MTLIGETLNARWTQQSMKLAANEFCIPVNTKMLIIFPEVFDRDILLQSEKFWYKYKDKLNNKQIGVKTPCSWCNSNRYVKFQQKTGYKKKQRRTACDFYEKFPIYSAIGTCCNPSCIGNPDTAKHDGVDKAKEHEFVLYKPTVWNSYPAAIRQKYQMFLYTEARSGADGDIFVTEDFCEYTSLYKFHSRASRQFELA